MQKSPRIAEISAKVVGGDTFLCSPCRPLNSHDCLEDRREDYQNCSVLQYLQRHSVFRQSMRDSALSLIHI